MQEKHKAKHSLLREKFSFISMLSLGSLVLGIVCVCWALINIGAQSVNYTKAYSSSSPSPITFAAKQARLLEDKAIPMKSDNTIITEPDNKSELLNSYKILYPVYPVEGDNIGSLSIPVLEQKMPIFQGTGSKELKKGIGHFIQSVLPGENDNCVLSGHRDTVFAKLGKLKIGDQLTVETSAGIFTYEINNIRIVDKDDRTVIVPTDHAVLTLTTCYPFLFIGSAPYRYILSADLVISE
ncbi:MAG: class D sortase [Candidatus Humimicrobiaceae bacterium]